MHLNRCGCWCVCERVCERECVIITKEKISVVSESIRKGDNIRERGERELL